MSHLFSQWGAKYAPKVVATVNGKKEKIFGWHTPAVGEYTKFLESFLPQLTAKIRKWEIADVTYFHISDEQEKNIWSLIRLQKNPLEICWTDFTHLMHYPVMNLPSRSN